MFVGGGCDGGSPPELDDDVVVTLVLQAIMQRTEVAKAAARMIQVLHSGRRAQGSRIGRHVKCSRALS